MMADAPPRPAAAPGRIPGRTIPRERQDFCDWTDVCRALAASLVAVSHVRDVVMTDYHGQTPWLPFYAATGLGHSGVIVFFVLSGYWISRSVLRRIDGAAFWPAYLIDRVSRLGIVLVPALVLGGALDAVGSGPLHLPIYRGLTGAHGISQNIGATLTLPVLLGNLAFLQTIAVPPWGSNAPLWSLAYEFWYYLWFPALAVLVARRRLSWALPTLALGLANPGMYWGFASWLVGWGLLRIEVWSAQGRRGTDPAASARPAGRIWAVLAATQFAVLLGACAISRRSGMDLPLAISFGLLLLALMRTALPMPRLLAPVAHYGRAASFSLYAIHFPLVALVGGWLTGPTRLAPGGHALALVLGLSVLCLIVGWYFARGTEAWTPRLRGWLRQRLPAAPLARHAA